MKVKKPCDAEHSADIKKLVKTVDLSTFGMVFYNNLLCLPFFAVVGMSSETEFLDSISDLSA